jgi:hypothetical protein
MIEYWQCPRLADRSERVVYLVEPRSEVDPGIDR